MSDALSKEAANAINGAWMHSMYWKRDEFGHVVLEGYRKMLEDAEKVATRHESRAARIRELIPEIHEEIAKRERWEDEDRIAEEEGEL